MEWPVSAIEKQRLARPALLVGMMLLAAPGRVAAQATAPTIDELIAKAERQGALRVIVELKIDPQGHRTARRSLRRRIAS